MCRLKDIYSVLLNLNQPVNFITFEICHIKVMLLLISIYMLLIYSVVNEFNAISTIGDFYTHSSLPWT